MKFSLAALFLLLAGSPVLAGSPGAEERPLDPPKLTVEEAMAWKFEEDGFKVPSDEEALANPFPVYDRDPGGEESFPDVGEDLSRMVLEADELLLLVWLRNNKALPLALLSGEALAKVQKVLLAHLAPIEAATASRTLTFGEMATVTCIPGRSTAIRLGDDEEVTKYWFGDPARWQSATGMVTGRGVPYVVIRPSQWGLRTNLVILTNQRSYYLELVVPKGPPVKKFDGLVSFFYPQDWSRKVEETLVAQAAAAPGPPLTSVPVVASPTDLNFDYKTTRARRRRHRLDWSPGTVFDDGERVWIHLPTGPAVEELPVVLGVRGGGETYPLNVHREGKWLVVHQLFSSARLAVGNRYLGIEGEGR